MNTNAAAPEHDWDPLDPATRKEPFTTHQRLRSECPVAHSEQFGGFWALMAYDDVVYAARNPSLFTSTVISAIPDVGIGLPKVPLSSDPPDHTDIRKLLQPFFSRSRVASREGWIREAARKLVADAVAQGQADLVKALTVPLPLQSLLTFLNIPTGDAPHIRYLCDGLTKDPAEFDSELPPPDPSEDEPLRGRTVGDLGEMHPSIQGLIDYTRELIARRRQHPEDPEVDLMSSLLLDRPGRHLTDDEIVGCFFVLLIAGHETTTNAIGNTIQYLAENPEQQERARRDHSLIPALNEELLRFRSPTQALGRVATQDVEVGGRTLRKGERIALVWASANRDESVFPDADRCVPDRTPNRHIAFGIGIHHCIGADMARLVMRVAIEELLDQTSSFQPAGRTIQTNGWPLLGTLSLPMDLQPSLARTT